LPGRQASILVHVLRTFPHGSLVLALIPYGCTCNRRTHYSLFYLYFTAVGNASAFNFPLYKDAPLSTEASWYATDQYAVANKLSYQATAQLLELIQIHCPSPNSCPKSLYLLKKHLSRDHCKVPSTVPSAWTKFLLNRKSAVSESVRKMVASYATLQSYVLRNT